MTLYIPAVAFSNRVCKIGSIDKKKKFGKNLNSIYQNLLEDNGVKIVFGEARLLDKNTVQVGEQIYQAEKILIATGSNPFFTRN